MMYCYLNIGREREVNGIQVIPKDDALYIIHVFCKVHRDDVKKKWNMSRSDVNYSVTILTEKQIASKWPTFLTVKHPSWLRLDIADICDNS